LLVFLCFFANFHDRCGRWGNTAQTLARWRHPVASSIALDVLHWAVRIGSYRRITMAIEKASK
jgi:hypothetical protein